MKSDQRILAEAFINAAGEVYLPQKADNLWRKVINEWIAMKVEPKHIVMAVKRLRQNRMTIGGISSLTKTLRDVMGERQIEDEINPLMVTSPEDAEKYYEFLKSRSTGE